MAPLTHHDRHQVYDHLIEQARFEALPCDGVRGDAHVLLAGDLPSEGDGGLDSNGDEKRSSPRLDSANPWAVGGSAPPQEHGGDVPLHPVI